MSCRGKSRKRRGGVATRKTSDSIQSALRASSLWLDRLIPLLIALITFLAFLPALLNNFVNWDDDKNLLDNPHYRGLGWAQLSWMWTTFHMGHYIPLTWMTFGLDYLFWEMNPFGYHLSSLLLHATNAVVFYFVARRILRVALAGPVERRPAALAAPAAVAALLFAMHPLRVESVAWATERRDVLSGLFYLLTILLYLRAYERGERGRRWYWLSVGVFACALLSKSMAVSLPVVLLILDAYPLRRLGEVVGWWGDSARRVYIEKIPFMLLAAAASAIALLALVRLNNTASLDQLSVLGRLAVSAYSSSFYLWRTIAPLNLSPLYRLPANVNPWAPPFLLSYGVVVAVTGLAWVFRCRWPGLAAAWLVYGVILLPVLGVFQNGPQIAADRYTYLAGLGWAMLIGASLRPSQRSLAFLPTGLAAGVLLGLGVLTWNQVQVWHDSERLWTHVLTIDPNSSIAENALGVLVQESKPAEAIERYRQALRIDPDYAQAHYNLGVALVQLGKAAEAVEHYREALRIKPDYARAHHNWGVALVQLGRAAEAIEHYQEALRIKPDYAGAYYNLGTVLVQQGKPAEAIEHYRQALKIDPDYAQAHHNWGVALVQLGKSAEAEEHFQRALSIRQAGRSNTTGGP